MPDDRFLHPRLRLSVKVSALNDLEFRVWVDYLLVADNFGVLPYRAAMMRAGNTALATRTEPEIQTALDHIVATGLLLEFEHQGQPYLCDPLWQDFQKIRYPANTYYPAPTPDIFPKLSGKTSQLFRKFHGNRRAFSRAVSRPSPRLKAKGLRQEANGLRSEEGSGEEPAAQHASNPTSPSVAVTGTVRQVLDAYHEHFLRRYGVKPVIHGAKDGATAKRLLASHGADKVLEMLRTYFESEDQFIVQAGHSFGAFWGCFNKLLANGARPRVATLTPKTASNADALRAFVDRGVRS